MTQREEQKRFKPKQIAKLNPNVLKSIQNVMDEDSSADILGDELADKLSEPNVELMVGVVNLVGHEVAVELFNKTKEVEAQGGMMIKNGKRRRTSGGVFLQLLRDYGQDENETRVNHEDVKLFFAKSKRNFEEDKKVFKRIKKERTAFLWAWQNGHKDVVKVFLDNYGSNIDLNAIDTQGRTTFMWACQNGHKDVVQILLDNSNIDLNAKSYVGRTGLMFACANGHKDVVQLLLDHAGKSIKLNAKDNSGKTAFICACVNGHKDIVKLLLDNSDRNINYNARNLIGQTAFMLVCIRGYQDIVQLLLDNSDRNIDLNARCNDGDTAFMWACANGKKDVVQLLLNHPNIDLNARDYLGMTAFMWACQSGHKDVVKLLIGCSKAKGIDVLSGQEEFSDAMRAFIFFQTIYQKRFRSK